MREIHKTDFCKKIDKQTIAKVEYDADYYDDKDEWCESIKITLVDGQFFTVNIGESSGQCFLYFEEDDSNNPK